MVAPRRSDGVVAIRISRFTIHAASVYMRMARRSAHWSGCPCGAVVMLKMPRNGAARAPPIVYTSDANPVSFAPAAKKMKSSARNRSTIAMHTHTVCLPRNPLSSDVERVVTRSSLANEGDRMNLLANPDALELSDVAVNQGRTRVAIADGRIVGFSASFVARGIIELEDLFVDPEWTRRGVGRQLVLDLVAIART